MNQIDDIKMPHNILFNNIPRILLAICFLCSIIELAQAFQGIPGIYCGLENCYDVLGATKESNRDEITKLYRSLARRWHPDRFQDKEERAAATEKFRQIATAYEVLKEDESRRDYNDMLEDPEQYYRHYYRYYRRKYTKVDPMWVIIGVISVFSLYQYLGMHSRYNELIDNAAATQKYRYQAQEIAKQKGLLPISDKRSGRDASGAKRSRHKSKEEIKQLEEAIIRQVIEENMDVRGGYAKPDIKNILWMQILRLPIILYNYIYWYLRWIYLFDFKGEPYGEDEKIYLIAKNLNVNEDQLFMNEDVDSLLRQELWIKEKFTAWKKRKEDEMREKLAEKPGYKRYRRYLKKGGPGQITFLDD